MSDKMTSLEYAEDAFEQLMAQTARMKFRDELHLKLAMSALKCSWECVERARQDAGYSDVH